MKLGQLVHKLWRN